MLETTYLPNSEASIRLRLQAKQKARRDTYSARLQVNWTDGQWRLRTQVNANIVADSTQQVTYGLSIHQDIQYAFPTVPLTLQLRLQGFDARHYYNRIYNYENDVLYGYSVPAVYGQGGRIYLNMRWQIIRQLGLYLRISNTVYAPSWPASHPGVSATRTDVHLLLRATL